MALARRLALANWILFIFFMVSSLMFWKFLLFFFIALALAVILLITNIIYLVRVCVKCKSHLKYKYLRATGIVSIVSTILFIAMFGAMIAIIKSFLEGDLTVAFSDQQISTLLEWLFMYFVVLIFIIAAQAMTIVSWNKLRRKDLSQDNMFIPQSFDFGNQNFDFNNQNFNQNFPSY